MTEHLTEHEQRLLGDPAAIRCVADTLVAHGSLRALADRDAVEIVRHLRRIGWEPALEAERVIAARTADQRQREAIATDALMQRWRDELSTLRRENERLRALLEDYS